MQIEAEQTDDTHPISALTGAAFRNAPHSHQREALIINALRAANALTLSLVARDAGRIVGHVAFSPVTLPVSGHWHGLGPVAVQPERQGQGIGTALIRDGLHRLRALGSAGCTVVGDPAYYTRFGFRPFDGLHYAGIPDTYVMALPFEATQPHGPITYHPAFDV